MAAPAAKARQYLVFVLGATRFGLPIEAVAEVVTPRELTALPQTPGFLKGLMRLREQVVPVIDLRSRFGLDESPVGRWIVVKSPSLVAYHVDRVDEVADCPDADLQPAPPAAAAFVPAGFLAGVFSRDQNLVLALKPEMLLTRDEKAKLKTM